MHIAYEGLRKLLKPNYEAHFKTKIIQIGQLDPELSKF